jgi:hypothetical protein
MLHLALWSLNQASPQAVVTSLPGDIISSW